MVKIIKGEVNSGKSTKFLRLYKASNSGAGLYSEKWLDDAGSVIGYDLVLLPAGKKLPFIFLHESIPPEDADNYYIQGKFAFLKETFKIAEQYILEYAADTPVWIDEIGGLELNGWGYDGLLKTLLAANRDVTFTVRYNLFEKIVAKYC